MANLELVGISKSYGSEPALSDFSLNVQQGEFVTLLGPSGCGKTTALRIIAGFVEADAGELLVDGHELSQVPANRRGFGMVFQSYSLFPHLSAIENVAFPLRLRKISGPEVLKRAQELLELVDLAQQRDKFPHQLSGGQQQRVALARAMAIEPRVLLLDEPLSALDAQVREQLRQEIRTLQKQKGITTVFVTHDQSEALSISDRIGVMNRGKLEQFDTPEAVYSRPATPFVARFVGLTNEVRVQHTGSKVWEGAGLKFAGPSEGNTGTVFLRPEHLRVTPRGIHQLLSKTYQGSITLCEFSAAGQKVQVQLDSTLASGLSESASYGLEVTAQDPLVQVDR